MGKILKNYIQYTFFYLMGMRLHKKSPNNWAMKAILFDCRRESI